MCRAQARKGRGMSQSEDGVVDDFDKGVAGNDREARHPAISFADMDGDGDVDIVVKGVEGSPYWVENKGGPEYHSLFQQPVFSTIVPTSMTWGDLDGDGVDEVIVGHMSGATVFRVDNQWSGERLGVSLASPRSIVVEDVNQDGLTDIVIRDEREVVLVENVDGHYGARLMTWPHLGPGRELAVGDVDPTNRSLEILTLDGEGVLGMVAHSGQHWQPFQPLLSSSVVSFQLVDLNRSGGVDIAIETTAGEKVWGEVSDDGEVVFHTAGELPEEVGDLSLETAAGSSGKSAGADCDSTVPIDNDDMAPKPDSPGVNAPSHKGDFSMMSQRGDWSLPAPEPSFDYSADPDVDFNRSSEVTADCSQVFSGVKIDLVSGESHAIAHPLLGILSMYYGQIQEWTDADGIVNAVGSRGADLILGDGHDNGLAGGWGGDWVFGNGGDDTLDGGRGRDLLFGGAGDDLVAGGRGNDCVRGDAGADILYGESGRDILSGNSGDDTLVGGRGADMLMAGSGDDALFGGRGDDYLRGGSGSDTFHYGSLDEGGDRVVDFTVGEDTFEFEFGAEVLHTVDKPYSGIAPGKGEGFVWESADGDSGILYFDEDLAVSGDETVIASVDLEAGGDLSVDDICVI